MAIRKWSEFKRAVHERPPRTATEAEKHLRSFLKRVTDVQYRPGGARDKLREMFAITALFAGDLSNVHLTKAFDIACQREGVLAKPTANHCTRLVKLVWRGARKSTISRYAEVIDVASLLSPNDIESRLLQRGVGYLLSRRNQATHFNPRRGTWGTVPRPKLANHPCLKKEASHRNP